MPTSSLPPSSSLPIDESHLHPYDNPAFNTGVNIAVTGVGGGTGPDGRHQAGDPFVVSFSVTDDAVIVEFWLRGTHRGPFRGIPATGQAFEVRMTAYFIFEGERLVCERVYFDSLTMVRQLLAGVSLRKPSSLLILLKMLGGLRLGVR